jgi:hypothetical protein
MCACGIAVAAMPFNFTLDSESGAAVAMLVFGVTAFVGIFVYEAVNYNK